MDDHRQTVARVGDYVDGVLSERDRRRVEKHLETCSTCAAEVEATRALVAAARQLPKELNPERDLWPGVRSRLGPRLAQTVFASAPPASRWRRFLDHGLREGLAAAAAVAVLLTGTYLAPLRQVPGEESGPAAPRTARMGRETPTAIFARMMWGMQIESRGAERTLSAAARTGSNPGLIDGVQGIDRSLDILDRAITAASEALLTDPENPDLLERLSGYYRMRASLLHRATQLVIRS
jgi:anti-sigma factor RsiW